MFVLFEWLSRLQTHFHLTRCKERGSKTLIWNNSRPLRTDVVTSLSKNYASGYSMYEKAAAQARFAKTYKHTA